MRSSDQKNTCSQQLAEDPTNYGALLRMAEIFRRERRFSEARRTLRRALYHYPSDANLRLESGRVELLDGQFESALGLFENLIADQESLWAAWVGRLRCLRTLGRQAELVAVASTALKIFPDSAQICSEVAEAYKSVGEYAHAVEVLASRGRSSVLPTIRDTLLAHQEYLETVAQRFDRDRDVLLEVAEAYVDLGQDGLALRCYERVLSLETGDEGALLGKLRALSRLRRFSDAEALAKGATISPSCPSLIRQEHADLLWRGGRVAEAVDVLGSPRDALQLLSRRDRQHDARLLLEAASHKWPGHSELRKALASELKSTNRLDEALAIYQSLMLIEPSDSLGLELLDLYQKLGRYREAGEILRASSTSTNDSAFLKKRGLIELEQGNYADAIASWRKVDLADQLSGQIHNLLSTGHVEKAWRLTEAALAVAPDDARVWLLRTDVHNAAREFKAAIDACRRSVDLDEQADSVFWLISLLVWTRQFVEAEKILRNAEMRFGSREEKRILEQTGWLSLAQHRHAPATAAFQQLLSLEVFSAAAWEGLSRCQYVVGNDAQALATLDAALAKNVRASRLYLWKGEILFRQANFQDALDCWRQAEDLADPRDSTPFLRRAEALCRLDRRRDAEAQLEKWLERSPGASWPQVSAQLASLLADRNDFARALEVITAIPDQGGGALKLASYAYVHFRRGEYQQAASRYKEALDLEEHEAYLHNNVAWALIQQVAWSAEPGDIITEADHKLLAEAARLAHKALDIDPRYASAHSCLGTIARTFGRLLESESHMLESIRASTLDGDYSGLGALYAQMGRFEEAETRLQEACRLSPIDSQARIELGRVYLQSDRVPQAVRSFRQAVALAPHDAVAVRLLAIALSKLGQSTEAIHVLDRAVGQMGASKGARLHLLLGQMFAALMKESGDLSLGSDALLHAQRSIEIDPSSPDAHFCAGIVCFSRNANRDALIHLNRCLEYDENHLLARRFLSLIAERSSERWRSGAVLMAGSIVALLSLSAVGVLWYGFLMQLWRIDTLMVTTLSPLLLGVAIMSLVLPFLFSQRVRTAWRLKLPGIEAELDKPSDMRGPWGGFEYIGRAIARGPR